MIAIGLPAKIRRGDGTIPHLDGVTQEKSRAVLCTAISHCRHPRVEMLPDVLRGLHRQDFIRQRDQIIAGANVTDPDEVYVAIAQSGQDRSRRHSRSRPQTHLLAHAPFSLVPI